MTINPAPKRLIRCMQFVACLSAREARYAIRDWRLGLEHSGEAVNHFGGIREVLQRAIAVRHTVRMFN